MGFDFGITTTATATDPDYDLDFSSSTQAHAKGAVTSATDGRPRLVECGVGMDRVVDIARPTAELVTQVCDVDAEPVATHQ